LLHLNKNTDIAKLQADGAVLLQFALVLADIQEQAGRHYVLENPQPSQAWKQPEMTKFLDEHDHHLACFHQCRFGLRGKFGLHRRATKVATSSWITSRLLDGKFCNRLHQHQPVLGGKAVTEPAGHYPHRLAKLLVDCIERPAGEDESELSEEEEKARIKASAGLKAAIKRLHDNTGHRSNLRLARAYTVATSGAPAEAIHAAKHHKCEICHEKRQPKARRPASWPTPKDAGDQANIDLLDVVDSTGTKFIVVHIIDYATSFQLAELLPKKQLAM